MITIICPCFLSFERHYYYWYKVRAMINGFPSEHQDRSRSFKSVPLLMLLTFRVLNTSSQRVQHSSSRVLEYKKIERQRRLPFVVADQFLNKTFM